MLFVCIYVPVATAHAQDIRFHRITTEDGLLNNSTIAIAQDSTGFMWLGTVNGLSRYDGSAFKNYVFKINENSATTYAYILSICCDSHKRLWVGTSAGLKCYNEKLDVFESVPIHGKINSRINNIYEDKKHRLWVVTSEGLFVKHNIYSDKGFVNFENDTIALGNNSIRKIFEDSKGNIWIAASNGLIEMQPEGSSFVIRNFYSYPIHAGSITSVFISDIAEDPKGNIWIAGNNGVNILNNTTGAFRHIRHSSSPGSLINNNVRKIICTRKGQMWAGTQEGLSIINPLTLAIQSYQNETWNNNSLSKNSIHSLLEDRDGSVWVGTYFGGINCYYAYNTNFHIIQNTGRVPSVNNNVISSIQEDDEKNLWIGTEGGGLNFLNRKSGSFIAYKNQPDNPSSLGSNLVKTIYIDNDQNLWCGTHGGGLNVKPKGKAGFVRYLYQPNDPSSIHTEVFSVAEDNFGRFWVGTNRGLQLFRKKGIQLTPLTLSSIKGYTPDFSPMVLFKDAEGVIWLGGEPGLHRIDGDVMTTISRGFNVNTIQQDALGNIWAGLNYEGLVMYDKKVNQLTKYNTNALQGKSIFGILLDNSNNLWLSSDAGLIRFNPKQLDTRIYTVSDGLPGNEFNIKSFFKSKDGTFFFGGFNGLISFFPDQIESNRRRSPIVFTGLKLFNRDVAIGDESGILSANLNVSDGIRLKYGQNVFTIEYALLNFIKSSKNHYQYTLQGFDKGWNTTDNSLVTYTNLSPGNYVFMVKGANNDGVWSDVASIKIKVLPPMWRTWWAYSLYVLALSGLLFLLLRFLYLQALIKKEESLHQIKLNFFTNVSHEIRTHLSLIMGPIEKLIDANSNNKFFGQQLATVKDNAERLLRLVQELMDFRKAENNLLPMHFKQQNFIPFLQNIYESFSGNIFTKKY